MVNAAAYKYDITPHQTLYIGGQGLMTVIILQSGGPGQQQQSSQQFSTGKWTAVPLLYALSDRSIVIISTLQETYTLQIQGSQTQMSAGALSGALEALISQTAPSPLQKINSMPEATMPSMQPMAPMQPMNMTMKPMSMNMGNMGMTMASGAVSTSSFQSSTSRHATPQNTVSNQPSNKETAGHETAGYETAMPNTAEPQQKVKRFCSQCGEGVQPGDRFCAYCGNAL